MCFISAASFAFAGSVATISQLQSLSCSPCPTPCTHRCSRLQPVLGIHQGVRFSRSATKPVGRPSEAPAPCGQSLLFHKYRARRCASDCVQKLIVVLDPILGRGGHPRQSASRTSTNHLFVSAVRTIEGPRLPTMVNLVCGDEFLSQ